MKIQCLWKELYESAGCNRDYSVKAAMIERPSSPPPPLLNWRGVVPCSLRGGVPGNIERVFMIEI